MIRHLITLIWNQRKQNGWIFAELALVLLAVFMITDGGYSKYTLYNEPLGYNIDRCWRLHLEEMESDNEGYTGEDERGAKYWERITELTRRLMNTGEVEAVGCSFYSCPYSQGNSWTSVEPAGADSVNAYSESLHRQLGDVGAKIPDPVQEMLGKGGDPPSDRYRWKTYPRTGKSGKR